MGGTGKDRAAGRKRGGRVAGGGGHDTAASATVTAAFRHVHPHGAVCYDFWCAFGESERNPYSDAPCGIDQPRIAYAITNGSLIGYSTPLSESAVPAAEPPDPDSDDSEP